MSSLVEKAIAQAKARSAQKQKQEALAKKAALSTPSKAVEGGVPKNESLADKAIRLAREKSAQKRRQSTPSSSPASRRQSDVSQKTPTPAKQKSPVRKQRASRGKNTANAIKPNKRGKQKVDSDDEEEDSAEEVRFDDSEPESGQEESGFKTPEDVRKALSSVRRRRRSKSPAPRTIKEKTYTSDEGHPPQEELVKSDNVDKSEKRESLSAGVRGFLVKMLAVCVIFLVLSFICGSAEVSSPIGLLGRPVEEEQEEAINYPVATQENRAMMQQQNDAGKELALLETILCCLQNHFVRFALAMLLGAICGKFFE